MKNDYDKALDIQVALAACAGDEQGSSNTGSDGSSTDAVAVAGTIGDASTISSARGDASSITPTALASTSASGGVSSPSGTTSSSWTAGVLSSIPNDDDDSGDGNEDGDSTREDISGFDNRTATAIRRSIHETPGAFYVIPTNIARDFDSSTVGPEDSTGTGTGTGTGTEQAPRSATPPPNSSLDMPVELAEAWVVDDGEAEEGAAAIPLPDPYARPTVDPRGSSSSSSVDVDVEPAIVTVTATPMKERRWFNTGSGGILLSLLFVGFVAVAVVIPVKKKKAPSASSAEPSIGRPFEIEVPSMPRDVSAMLEIKYNKFTENQPFVMAFSADLTVHASTLVDAHYGQLQVVRYNANSSSWELVTKYDEDEARVEHLYDIFGAWADMSYDGRILAVGLPRDDPLNVTDAGSVRVMELEIPSEHNGDSQRWSLKGHGNYIKGTEPYGWTGTTFSLSFDGSMIAVASPLASMYRGNIIVYKFESDETIANGGEWIQIGQAIIGDEVGSAVAFVKLSEDGSMLAACSFIHGKESGQVKIYRWDTFTNLWAQLGSAIEGSDKARLGVFPQFSRDGLTVALSQSGVPYKCHVYHWQEVDSDWESIGDDLVFPDGYVGMDLSPNGKRVLLCSNYEKRCILNSFHSGGWHEAQEFLVEEHGFLPYLFERNGDGDKIAGIVAPIGKEEGHTIGFYNIS